MLQTVQCLSNPDDAASITHSGKKLLHEQDIDLLIASAITHPSVEPVAQIAATVSGRKIWDITLDHIMVLKALDNFKRT